MRIEHFSVIWRAALLGVFLAVPALPTTASTYTAAQRFQMIGQEDLSGAEDVAAKQVSASELPEPMIGVVKEVLDQCVEGGASVDEPQYYSYESRRLHAMSSPPNYIVDFRPLAGKAFKTCAHSGSLCVGQSCQLSGYVYNRAVETWRPAFNLSVTRWGFDIAKPASGKAGEKEETYLSVVSDTPACEEQRGRVIDGYCVQKLVWRGEILSPLNMSSPSSGER